MVLNNSTIAYKFGNAERFANSIVTYDSTYYMFASDFLTHSNTQLQPVYDNPSNTYITPYNNMIFGKIITPSDIAYGVQYIPWTSNTVYAMYDDQSSTLSTDLFFTITNEGSYFHIWKILDNNLKAPSTVQPLFSFVSSSNTYNFQTSDGYRWKYMSSIPQITAQKFQVGSSLFPVFANSTVASIAVQGSIDVIYIANQGKLYNNYINGVLKAADIYPTGNNLIFNISNNNVVTTTGYYTGCLLYITSGVAKGQYRTITNYTSNSSGNYIFCNNQLLFNPQNGDTYSIYPQVNVVGDGTQTINCIAYAQINALNSNSVYNIQVLNSGANYRSATATVVANSIVGVSNTATLRVINTPYGGHGANVFTELYCHSLILSAQFNGNESNTIPSQNQYQTFGIVKDPVWANVNFNFSVVSGNFQAGEVIYQLRPIKINANATVTVSNNIITCNTGDFINQMTTGDLIYYSTPDATLAQLNMVLYVANANYAITVNNSNFSCTSVNMFALQIISNAVISSTTVYANSIYVANSIPKTQEITSFWMGATSGARGILNNVNISGENKNYNTFVATYQYLANVTSGTFTQGETIQQGNSTAYLHSVFGSSGTVRIYATGAPLSNSGGPVVGLTSNAHATIQTTYPPEILFESGKIQYIENISPVTRQNNEVEMVQLVLSY